MTDPMERFRNVFFEESAEAIDAIEQHLLSIALPNVDNEVIHDIFRSAHSLKGGSATFGMTRLAEFTHVMETLLDSLRNGERSMDQDIVDCLFSCLDTLRSLVSHYQYGDEIDGQKVDSVRHTLEGLLSSSAATAPAQAASAIDEDSSLQWQITFIPERDVLKTGNEPLRYIEELAELGTITVEVNTNAIPSLSELEPTALHLQWHITLDASAPVARQDLADVFMWLEDEAELIFTPLTPAIPSVAPVSPLPAPAEAPAAPATAQNEATASATTPAKETPKRTQQSIRVDLAKIDSLINLLGELVITQSMLSTFSDLDQYPELQRLQQGLGQLERHTRDLQDGVMQIRMLPIDFCFSRFPRMVRDICKSLGKEIRVDIVGETTEVDKTVIEELTDPLVHLVRNSIDHGIERPDVREENGKPRTGVLTLKAFHQVGNIVIEVSDDGAGLNADKLRKKAIEKGLISASSVLNEQAVHELIFAPGFSTAEQVTDLSGRGVGMDVVKRNIQGLGGHIDVRSTLGKGTTFSIRLPLTLSILDGQLVKVHGETYVIPMLSIIESIQVPQDKINQVEGKDVSFKWRGEFIPVLDLAKTFHCPRESSFEGDPLIVVVESDNRQCGLMVDELANHQQVVVKSLEANYKRVDELSGATILGDGTVALILDVGALIQRVKVH
ncbi:chemotaxis protein CheA [Aestuariibacter halophilus]|uniref:Chemotaxis protein CheA n=1 Tax=Fluctibacter halophilus TaxID=226011 RepID=A0ABS8G9Y3_9ALTE|nr:chemotaxis protein CheA [Aestuariibacter halophilus]MCC2616036.1 chemotaxis protein CheA [Aestuariibacter halophilus]